MHRFLLLALLPLAACSGPGTSTPAVTTTVMLDPTLGVFAFDDNATAATVQGATPEAAALAYVGPPEAEGGGTVTAQTLAQSSDRARVAVTATNLLDDSVRDKRTLFVFSRRTGTWRLVAAGYQTRCQTGRGHQDWAAANCL